MNATAYTPLESLLLFQSLAAFGTEPNVFAQISNLLKNNVLIQECDKYDAGRLSPDALRELYLQLLREELRSELEAELPGDASPSRKRKIQAPPLPTISDAKNYKGKIPQLVDRLYSRYRDHMIRAIHEDERRYEQLQREIAEIGRGEWDERLRQEQNRGSRTSSEDFRRPPSIPRSSAQPERPASRDKDRVKAATPSPAPSPRTETRPEGLSINDVLNSTEPPPKLIQAPEKDSISRLKNGNHSLPPISHHRTASNERPHGPSPLQQGQRLPPPSDWKWENSYQAAPPPLPPTHQAPSQPPHGYPPPYPPQQQQQQQQQPPQYGQYPPRGSFSSSTPQPHSVPSSPHAPHNPIVLPPLNGRGSGSPASHLDQLAEAADQQYRPAQSPLIQQQTSGLPMPPHYTTSAPQTSQYVSAAPQSHAYPAQYGQHPPPPPPFRAPSHPSQTPPPPQWNSQQNGYQQYPPQQQLPPPPPNNNYYSVPAPAPAPPPAPTQAQLPQARQSQPPSFAAPRSELPQIQQQQQYNSPYNAGFTRPPGPEVKGTPIQKPLFKDHLKESAPSTPASRPQSFKTGKSTLWKSQATPGTPKPPVALGTAGYLPESPAYEPISPPPPQPALPPVTSEPAKQQTPQTAQKDTPRRSRPPRTRESSDAPTEPGTPFRNGPASAIKKEGLAQQRIGDLAPADPENELAPTTPSTKQSASAAESSDEFAVPQAAASTSRKRKISPQAERESKPATHVLWTRNFPKISASALERIGAHRTASTFALPIKDRDAPGYREAIKRPMDLKSIKAAITAGNRAGTAMLREMEEKGEEVDKNAMVVELPVTRDLLPPKGIVNSRQLERELMLMFANAVMFNPDAERGINLRRSTRNRREGGYALDEDGVVKDARTMAADVQVIINELRETERKRESESVRNSVVMEQEKSSASREKEGEERENEESAAEGQPKKRKRTTKE